MSTEAERTRVIQLVTDRFSAHGPRAGAMHWYSKLACRHLVDHGAVDRVDARRLPETGTTVCCRRCTNAARGRG